MDEETLQAQQAIQQILAGLNIEIIVCIDDIYAVDNFDNTIALTIGWFAEALSRERSKECNSLIDSCLGQSSFFDVPDDEIWKRRLTEHWPNLEEDKRVLILDGLAKMLNADVNIERDRHSASLLKTLIPDNVELRELTPAEWENSCEEILRNADDEKGLLCLFDHNLKGAHGYTDDSGILLLTNAINVFKHRSMIYGLLTHTIEVDQEISRSGEFAKTHNLKREDFLVLSKARLNVPMQFAHGLKMMSLNHARDSLTAQIRNMIDEANGYASDKLLTVDVYDFEHMVLRSSEKEGVWEPETLFRLFDIFRLAAFRENVFTPENKSSLNSKIAQIRAIREVATLLNEQDHPPNQRWEIRRLELYEQRDFINKAHLPLELGDIFQIGEGKFILIAQPCDLIIRGKDDYKGRRQAEIVTLVKITNTPPQNPEANTSFPLNYFDETGGKAYIKFRSAFHVSTDVLDLAVFNADGKCKLNLADTTILSTLHLPWRERSKIVKRKFEEYQRQFNELFVHLEKANLRRESKNLLEKALTAKITSSNINIQLNYNLIRDGVFDFEIHRIGRLRQPIAGVLLSNFFAFLARNAEEHDFTAA